MSEHKTPWNPRPRPEWGSLARTGYFAGYSDGYHDYNYASGYTDPPQSYRIGFDEGRQDRPSASKPEA